MTSSGDGAPVKTRDVERENQYFRWISALLLTLGLGLSIGFVARSTFLDLGVINLGTLDLVSLASSVASLILSVLAISLSIVFYRLSAQEAKTTEQAAFEISSNVNRLNALFEKLYTDFFAMHKDTVADIRKMAYDRSPSVSPETMQRDIEEVAQPKLQAIKEQFDSEVATLIAHQKTTDSRLDDMTGKMQDLLERAMSESRRADREARVEVLHSERARLAERVAELRRSIARGKDELSAIIARFDDMRTRDDVSVVEMDRMRYSHREINEMVARDEAILRATEEALEDLTRRLGSLPRTK